MPGQNMGGMGGQMGQPPVMGGPPKQGGGNPGVNNLFGDPLSGAGPRR